VTPVLAIRVGAALCIVLVAAACGGGGAQTIAENRSGTTFIVRSTDDGASRYYALPPAATVVVDDMGEANPAADAIDLLDTECGVVGSVEGDFWGGGVITVEGSAAISFVPGRRRSGIPRFLAGPDETTYALTTCEAAVQAAGV
jgi:hypothetical protein